MSCLPRAREGINKNMSNHVHSASAYYVDLDTTDADAMHRHRTHHTVEHEQMETAPHVSSSHGKRSHGKRLRRRRRGALAGDVDKTPRLHHLKFQ